MRTSLRIVLVAGGLFLLFSKLFYDLYSGASDGIQPNLANDVINHGWPFFNFARASALSGTLPLWNPYTSLGTPFLAEIGLGLFYPLTWIIVVAEVPAALLLIQFLTVLIGMAGMYCYTRYLALQPAARFLCTTLFAYAVFTESFYPTMGYAYCWIPVLFWLCHRLLDFPDLRNSCYVGIALALCFLGGFPNYFVYTVLILGVYCACLISLSWQDTGLSGISRTIGMGLVALLLMLGLVAIQLLPSYELSSLSPRNINSAAAYDPDSVWELFSLGLLFRNFLQTDLIYLFGNELIKAPSGISYLGGALLLLPFGVISAKFRKISIALFAALVVLSLFILSYKVEALALLQQIPFASSIRVNGRAAGYIQFILIIISGIGLSTLLEQAMGGSKAVGRARLAWVLLFSAYSVWLVHQAFLANENLWFLLGLLPCFFLIMVTMTIKTGATHAARIGWLLALIVVVDVSVHRDNRFLVPAFMPDDNDSVTSAVNQIRQLPGYDRVIFEEGPQAGAASVANYGPKYQIQSIDAYMGLTSARWENYIRYMLGPEIFDELVSRSVLQRFYGYFSPHLLRAVLNDPRILESASLRYIVTDDGLIETKNPLPRAFSVGHYVLTSSEEESLSAIKNGAISLADTVILENARPSFAARGTNEDLHEVRIQDYSLNEVVLSTENLEPSIVVLTDAYFPGWEAFVDGNSTEIFRANSLFRAVEVPAGAHTVVFRYRPESLYRGLFISLSAACLITFFLFRCRSDSP